MHGEIDKTALIIHGGVALAGGYARALSCHHKRLMDTVVSTVIAGFTGTIFGMLSMHFLGDGVPYLTLSISGAGGLMGEKGIFYLIEIVKKSIAVNFK